MPVIIKRLDARYDWLMARWGQRSYELVDAGDGCSPLPSLAGAVAWVSEGNCSFFTKVCECCMFKFMFSFYVTCDGKGHNMQPGGTRNQTPESVDVCFTNWLQADR